MKIKYKIRVKRKGKEIIQNKTKNVKVNGKLLQPPKRGNYTNRFSNDVHGIKILYTRKIKGGAGRGGRIKQMNIEKIVTVPKKAFDVKVEV